ncbi:MAG: ABC transporter permease [Lachnospiraceae bacterium]|jgi:peptide/nickel transport system permease protein|nr:ABC transporter permease [Lachnospiraceae bacterium]MBQ2425470.1 ABC transporter permease [Lachnospiraceae bacterium]MBQ5806174.1 ABC transporter permease [Lachnospiraceae bacterium]MBQ5869641.1 ABC transporter permease [Lachnospiraceae bacterium]MBQ5916434.1 ABC transporter permease [Lachnospiraceae bacterium]
MSRYVLKRLVMLIPVLIGVTFLVYFIISLSPGDTAAMLAGEDADAATIEALRHELGLDQPVIVQYAKYMLNLLQGDMGNSYKTGRPVTNMIVSCFPNTAKLAFWSILVAVGIALPIGVISATKQYSMFDNVGMVVALIGVATPNFWLGLMMIILFSLNLGWLPSGGNKGWSSYIMPAITLGTGDAALITRMTRSSMLEVIRADYIRTARAKGVPENKVVYQHALRNALIPVVTAIGLQFGSLLGGATLTETVFAWPGIGRSTVDSIKTKDTTQVLGNIVVLTITFSCVNLLVDILYAFIDPRIKAQYKK